jgi:hypothetical protein
VKRFFCCLVLGAVPVPGQVPERPIADIAVYYGFEHEPPAVFLEALKDETACILQPVSQSIEWQPIPKTSPGASTTKYLVVVRFKGNCDLSSPAPKRPGGRALGWTHITDGVVLPFSDVNCDRIRAFLSSELRRLTPGDRETVFGRAAGRVLAHELHHVLANTRQHGEAGVAKSGFTIRELMGDTVPTWEAEGMPPDAGPAGTKSEYGQVLFEMSRCGRCHGNRGEGSANGPGLRAPGRRLDVLTVVNKLGDRAGEMYRRARDLRISLRTFSNKDTHTLVDFLNSGSK